MLDHKVLSHAVFIVEVGYRNGFTFGDERVGMRGKRKVFMGMRWHSAFAFACADKGQACLPKVLEAIAPCRTKTVRFIDEA
jgi:hypothetical protein